MWILPAFAEGTDKPPMPNMLIQLVPFIAIILIFYFLLIRPQKKRQDEHQKMIGELKKGDDVVTAGGLIGQIADVRDDHFVLKIADNVRIKVTRSSVSHKVAPGAPVTAEARP